MDYCSEKCIDGWHPLKLNGKVVYIPPSDIGESYWEQIVDELMDSQLPTGAIIGTDGVVYSMNKQPHRGKGGNKTPIHGLMSRNTIIDELKIVGYVL